MANITLPTRFKQLLEKDQALDGLVKTTLSNFGEILKENRLYFFEEYTDHGIEHIEKVLAASEMLITESTFDILTSTDIAYYTLAVLLHDIGMHIGLDGFKMLLNGEFDDTIASELDIKTWEILWNEYIDEAKRFSGMQLKSIFGQEDIVIKMPKLDNAGTITNNDKKLIGEFIRRNHARLAHEISLKGFPGKNILLFTSELDIKHRDVIGIVARSHGSDLRNCADYIEMRYGRAVKRFFLQCHTPYLMVLLRIADYIQIDASRTSKNLIKLKTFSSPISELEHYAHLSIDDIDFRYQDDPERIYVTSSPADSKMFLKIRKLIAGIQLELDACWATLGELYGKDKDIDRPAIKYRRIISNLENHSYVSRLKYVADSFSFKANDEIAKLLIAPLYGDNPSYGVRELLQNSIDACKEREWLEKIGNTSYTPQIDINLKKVGEEYWFIIQDNGIGMDLNVIKNYFLSAGASYRKSIEWQKSFMYENNQSKIRRTGRFGVGILAAYLLGEEINVKTKKPCGVGYSFTASLNDEQINIINDETEVGTIITIKLRKEAYDKMDIENKDSYGDTDRIAWHEWYVFKYPEIKYLINGQKLEYDGVYIPNEVSPLPFEWNAIHVPGYQSIIWTFDQNFRYNDIVCNGIIINDNGIDDLDTTEIFRIPSLSIEDSDGNLPLSLDRSRVTHLPFHDELLIDVVKDFIACLLTFDPAVKIKSETITLDATKGKMTLMYPGLLPDFRIVNPHLYGMALYSRPRSFNYSNLLFSKNGFIINHPFFLSKIGDIDILHVPNLLGFDNNIQFDIKNSFLSFSKAGVYNLSQHKSAIVGENTFFSNPLSRCYMATEIYLRLFDDQKHLISRNVKNRAKIEYQDSSLTVINFGMDNPSVIKVKDSSSLLSHFNFVREHTIDASRINNLIKIDYDTNLIEKVFSEYFTHNFIIPYSMEERKKLFPLAFIELERYMKKYLK